MLKNMVNAVTGIGKPPAPGPVTLAPSKSGSTQNMSANVKVVVRVRPLNKKENEQNSPIVVEVVDDKMLVFDPKEEIRPFFYHGIQQPNRNYLKRANKELKFVFDNVCGQNASNREVFETTTKDILASLMEGYNCSVFAYGATGAGKTFTMIGNEDHPGITYLTMDHLFHTFSSFEKDREFDIGVSYIEVYNENVYDLLKPSKTPLQLREDTKYGVTVAGLTLHKINTAGELLNMLENGNKNRTQHPTDANAESSRSHAVFQVYIKMRYKTSSQLRVVKLSMIDLAGSERASATGCVGERFKEGANINKSLLSLGNCINKLADGGSYIPYRDSKLTRLLKDSLGGNCKTVMIANISPSGASYDDTYNTLKYAARANKIQLSIKKNIVDGNMRASQYIKMNEELKKKVIELEAKLSLSTSRPVKEMDSSEEKLKQDWHRLIYEVEASHAKLEGDLLTLMVKQRVLALRHLLRTETFAYMANLAHRSSTEALEEFCTENFPRRERSTENYLKQSMYLDSKIKLVWTKWNNSRNKFQGLLKQALTECAELKYFVNFIELQGELRLWKANAHLNQKLFSIEKKVRKTFQNCMSGDMPCMLKKLYLTLKGYDLAPPALTAEYLEIMKKSKLDPSITWYDKSDESDSHYKFISTLDFENPTATLDFNVETLKSSVPLDSENLNTTIDLTTDDSDELTNIENQDSVLSTANKTPIKLANNETVLINKSLESLDTMANRNLAKKFKLDHDTEHNVENYGTVDPNNLNSTFVLAGKMAALKRPIKMEVNGPMKREFADRTNTLHRNFNFNDKATFNIVKPVIGKALPLRRVQPASRPAPGFGSSLSRDGTPLQRNIQAGGRLRLGNNQSSVGYKTVNVRDRVRPHPYTRPVPDRRP